MPNIESEVSRAEITVPIQETELLTFLFSRYNIDELSNIGIHPQASVIRSMVIDPQGRCEFRVCSISHRNVERELDYVERRRMQKFKEQEAQAETPTEPNEGGCPSEECAACATQGAIRIRKS